MKITDFEKAVAAIGVDIVEIRLKAKTGGQVSCCYGTNNKGTYIMWDSCGRGFVCEYLLPIEGDFLYLLPYERDEMFDLKFE